MSDLSWLNPTPHAIAVYASRPLSPVAAQHSLPSGRYSLLGPDFHRLDRTSLRLAHSLDHLVGEDVELGRNRNPQRARDLAIDHQIKPKVRERPALRASSYRWYRAWGHRSQPAYRCSMRRLQSCRSVPPTRSTTQRLERWKSAIQSCRKGFCPRGFQA